MPESGVGGEDAAALASLRDLPKIVALRNRIANGYWLTDHHLVHGLQDEVLPAAVDRPRGLTGRDRPGPGGGRRSSRPGARLMPPTIAAHLPAIRRLCEKFGVRRLELFGSAAREDFDAARSDVDFLVEWAAVDPHGLPDRWWEFRQALYTLLDRDIDLVTNGSIGNSRLRRAGRNGRTRSPLRPDQMVRQRQGLT